MAAASWPGTCMRPTVQPGRHMEGHGCGEVHKSRGVGAQQHSGWPRHTKAAVLPPRQQVHDLLQIKPHARHAERRNGLAGNRGRGHATCVGRNAAALYWDQFLCVGVGACRQSLVGPTLGGRYPRRRAACWGERWTACRGREGLQQVVVGGQSSRHGVGMSMVLTTGYVRARWEGVHESLARRQGCWLAPQAAMRPLEHSRACMEHVCTQILEGSSKGPWQDGASIQKTRGEDQRSQPRCPLFQPGHTPAGKCAAPANTRQTSRVGIFRRDAFICRRVWYRAAPRARSPGHLAVASKGRDTWPWQRQPVLQQPVGSACRQRRPVITPPRHAALLGKAAPVASYSPRWGDTKCIYQPESWNARRPAQKRRRVGRFSRPIDYSCQAAARPGRVVAYGWEQMHKGWGRKGGGNVG